MERLVLALALVAAPALATPPPWAPLPEGRVERIAVGSCAYDEGRQPVWSAIRRSSPDLVLLLGDNVYADTTEPDVLAESLERLGKRSNLRRLARQVPFLSTWDDHDFGPNDADGRHPAKEAMRQVTLDFFGATADDARRSQEGGLYGAWTFGPPTQRLQVVLLDTRFELSPRAPRTDGGVGRYAPGPGQVLGKAQWAWLEQVLAEPADLRLIGSSIPFATEYTGWETWSNFPDEQARLVDALTGIGPVLVLSGDVHYGELSRHEGIYDLTSSGLHGEPYEALPNAHRVQELTTDGEHYALVSVDWDAGTARFDWLDPKGRSIATYQLPLAALGVE